MFRTLLTGAAVILALAPAIAAPLAPEAGRAEANGISIAYERFGVPGNETILLITGWGAQLTLWPEPLIERLVAGGYQVVRFDNRDAGLSTRLDEAGSPDWTAIFTALAAGEAAPVAYTIADMADDAAGLLDVLEIDAAHIVGFSMGGHIAQRFAIHHPERTLSLVSIGSDAGNPDLPGMSAEVEAIPPATADMSREDVVAREIMVARAIGSAAYPLSDEELRRQIEADIDRAGLPDLAAGYRQAAALTVDGYRRDLLLALDIPAVIIHGDADAMVAVENAYDTAESIPGAELVILPGLGHDFPEALLDEFAAAILGAARAASAASD